MCTIKKINSLKRLNGLVVGRVSSCDPLQGIEINSVTHSGLTYSDLSDKIKKISNCCSIVELKSKFVENREGLEQAVSVSTANYCGQHMVCPACADRSQARRQARFSDSIRAQAEKVKSASRYAYMLTYTVKDGENLSERLNHLIASKRRFLKMGQKRKRKSAYSFGEASKIKAAISTIEIKRGKGSNLWHAHCHDLIFTDQELDYRIFVPGKRDEYLHKKKTGKLKKSEMLEYCNRFVELNGDLVPASKISSEWFAATGDSMGIDVSPIRHVPHKGSKKRKRLLSKMDFQNSVVYQAKEALKYPYKPSDSDPEDLLTIMSDCYNRRLTSTYGEFRGVPGDDYNDPAGSDDETWCLVWSDSEKKYGDPVPGRYRDIIESELSTRAKREAGILLGIYRRQRRALLDMRDTIGADLSALLDDAKRQYRSRVANIYGIYRSAADTVRRSAVSACSPILAAAGMYMPGYSSGDIYSEAFTD